MGMCRASRVRGRPRLRGSGRHGRGAPGRVAGRRRGLPAILSRVTNRAVSPLRLTAAAATALVVSGCGVLAPVSTDEPYIPADGVPLTVPGLDLRNLAVVTSSEGGSGVVIGQLVNQTDSAVPVNFGIQGGETASTTKIVRANSGETISDDSSQVTLDALSAPAGSMVMLTVTTREAGENVVEVPVLVDDDYYTGLLGTTL